MIHTKDTTNGKGKKVSNRQSHSQNKLAHKTHFTKEKAKVSCFGMSLGKAIYKPITSLFRHLSPGASGTWRGNTFSVSTA